MKKILLIIIMVTCMYITCGNSIVISEEKIAPANRIDTVINSIVSQEHVDIVKAIIHVESRGDSLAVSKTGDYGIMQINKRTWQKVYDFNRILELEYNITAGYEILKRCLAASNGNMRHALKRYNGKWSYADKVMKVRDEQRTSY